MYPLNLEYQYEKLWEKEFESFAKSLNGKVLGKLKEAVTKGELSRSDSHLTFDADSVVRLDQTELLKFLEDLRLQYGDFVPREQFQNQIRKNLNTIDSWSRSQVGQAVKNQYQAMNNPPLPGNIAPDKSGFRVPNIVFPSKTGPAEGIVWEKLNERIRGNISLASQSFRDHYQAIQKAVSSGLSNGESYRTIADEITRVTGVSQSQATRWAKDQASKFFGKQMELRSKDAGFPGYYWRTQKDARVRDAHKGKSFGGPADQYWYWDSPPAIHRKNGDIANLNPGEDWHCRCYPEPAFPPEDKIKGGTKNPNPTIPRPIFPDAKPIRLSGALKIPKDLSPRDLKTLRPIQNQLQSMPKDKRIEMVHSIAENAKWDKTNLAGHTFADREVQFHSAFGKGMEEVVSEILKTKSFTQVFANNREGFTLVFFYNGKRVVIPIAKDREKIKSAFFLDDNIKPEEYFRGYIEIQ